MITATPTATAPASVRHTVAVGNVEFGGANIIIIAGPCAVESDEQLRRIAAQCRNAGAKMLRGGAFKPRTSPRSFQGLGRPALQMLRECSDELGIPAVTEVTDTRLVDTVAKSVDMLQVGSRNMKNYELLREIGRSGMPVLLKRGEAALISEVAAAAEYIAEMGNESIVICERGIRTFETSTRYTLDVAAVPLLLAMCPYPIIIDPSHAAGIRELVRPLALAGIAAGADGLIVEVHDAPERALCDGAQALSPSDFAELARDAARVAAIVR